MHRRSFGAGNGNANGQVPYDQEDSEEDHHLADQPEFFEEPMPLTNASRVRRRGRGGRPMTTDMYIENTAPGNLRPMPPEMYGTEDSRHIESIELSEDL